MLEKLTAGIKTAMREKDKLRLTTLRGIKSEADGIAKNDKNRAVTDGDVENAILKGIKQRNEAIKLYVDGNREDLADNERAEVAILEEFLPEQLDEVAITTVVDEVIKALGATSKKEMGKVMGAINGQITKGSADMKLVSKIVGSRLA